MISYKILEYKFVNNNHYQLIERKERKDWKPVI